VAEEESDHPDKLCFVVGPIGAEDSADRIHADWLLEMIIQPVMANYPEFEVKRADKISEPGMIDAQIIDALLNADLVIADLSSLNPNAFYEIGIRHMVQKPIIHMQILEETIPFDVSLFRSIKYSRLRPRDLKAAQTLLKSQIDAIFAEGYQVDNPVTRTRGVVALAKGATTGEKVLIDQIRALEIRLASVEKRTRPRVPSPPVHYGGGDPVGTTLFTFRSASGFDKQRAEVLQAALAKQFGLAVQVSLSGNEMSALIPGDVNVNDFQMPSVFDMEEIEIDSPIRPFRPT
jgi:hypothetical protein